MSDKLILPRNVHRPDKDMSPDEAELDILFQAVKDGKDAVLMPVGYMPTLVLQNALEKLVKAGHLVLIDVVPTPPDLVKHGAFQIMRCFMITESGKTRLSELRTGAKKEIMQ